VNRATRRVAVPGPAGSLELAIDDPAIDPVGLAVLCHPHPLHGGTLDNKVVQTLARAFVQCGWRSVRFNFRGVGDSQGAWAAGVGEVDDAWAVVQAMAPERPAGGRLAIAGFSFGGHVASHLAHRLGPAQVHPADLVLVAPAVVNFSPAPVPADALVLQGETDDVVPLAAVLDWARPQGLPVTVVPGAGHFFHGQLPLLRRLVAQHLRGAVVAPDPAAPEPG
jgi:uncharacterized protein